MDVEAGAGPGTTAGRELKELHERAAELQEDFAASQEVHAEHARQLGLLEMAVCAEGRAERARERARNERVRAAHYV